MSTPSRRPSAALRRSAASFCARVRPIGRASQETLNQAQVPRHTAPRKDSNSSKKRLRHACADAGHSPWKIESLEPRLLLSADPIPGVARIEGTIDQPGEQDAYEFVVTDKTKLFFDGTDGSQVQWQLRQGSTALFNSRDLTASGDRFLELQPGTYSLNVDGLNDTLGSYAFRLIGEQAATVLAVNQTVAGRLEAGTQAALYSFSAQAGDRLHFQTGSSTGSPRWTLFGPAANIVSGTNGWSDGGAFTADRSGTYWLSIEGQSGAAAAVDYGFTLFRSTPTQTPLQFGQNYTADLATPGAAASYTFTLTDATQVAWDQLSAPHAGLRWTLVNASGGQVASAQLDGVDGNAAPLLLTAGSYTLKLEALSRNAGSASFRLLSSAAAPVIGTQPSLTLTDDARRAAHVVRIDAAAAERLAIGLRADTDADGTTIATAIDLLTDGGASAFAAVTLGGNAAGAQDLRLYRVDASAGDPLLVSASGAGFAPRLRLFNTNGTELASAEGDTLRYTAGSSGAYYVGVSRAANAAYDPRVAFPGTGTAVAAATLTLSVTRIGVAEATSQPQGGDVPDVIGNARTLLLPRGGSITVPVNIGDGTAAGRDVDMYRITLQAGEVLRTTTPNGTFDGYERIFDATGRQVASADDSPLNWTVPASGTYYIGLSGWSNTGYNPNIAGSGSTGNTGTLSLTITRDIGSSTGAAWRITDAYGTTLSSGGLSSGQSGVAALPQAGTYYLWTYCDQAAASTSSFDIERWTDPAPGAASALVGAAITMSGAGLPNRHQVHTFDLNVAAGGTWLFEPQSADNGQWQLVGPQGTVSDWHTFSETRGAGASALYLTAGSYQLRVRLTSAPFALTATPLANAQPLQPDAPCSLATLDVGASAIWRFAAGRQDDFDVTAAADGEFALVAFDAYGRELYRSTQSTGHFYQGEATGDVYLRVTRLQQASASPALLVHRTLANLAPISGAPIAVD